MPKMYRGMISDDGLPLVGAERNMLGVRVPPSKRVDVTPDQVGNVSPNGRDGMSVNPSLSSMLMVHIPERWKALDPKFAGARGADIEVFVMGDGPFSQSDISADLAFTPTSDTHGVIEPARPMPVDDYQQALASTRSAWTQLLEPDGS